MCIDNRPPEIIAVSAEQIAIALALFRAAVLNETAEEAILPLSERGICIALLEEDALHVELELPGFIFNPATVFILWCKELSAFSNC